MNVGVEKTASVAIDLFCGAGGLSAGLHAAGWELICGVDAWEPAVRTYGLNFAHPALKVDLSTASASDLWAALRIAPAAIDLVAGGPPCQGFSVQRIGPDEDHRNDLVVRFAQVVLDLKPKMFLMENVPGLLGARGKDTARRFERVLAEGGYAVNRAIVNAADYGVPQTRRRVFYYGWLLDQVRPFAFPLSSLPPIEHRAVRAVIGDLPAPPEDYTPTPGDPLHRRMRLSKTNEERLRLIPPGGGFEDLPTHLRVQAHRNGAAKIGHRYVYGRLDPDKPASTITARFDSFTRGRFGHPFQDRNITLREGARLQSFADTFRFHGTQEEIAALIGNAIPPLQASIIGRALLEHIQAANHRPRQLPSAAEWNRQMEFASVLGEE